MPLDTTATEEICVLRLSPGTPAGTPASSGMLRMLRLTQALNASQQTIDTATGVQIGALTYHPHRPDVECTLARDVVRTYPPDAVDGRWNPFPDVRIARTLTELMKIASNNEGGLARASLGLAHGLGFTRFACEFIAANKPIYTW
jgi:hypothetical protein